ncbi:MAG: TraM recognition domain-containing protein, partial [Candidatus Vogelbacteria bacterium]|nr:TraM recognition domain-containing protein [Candidatus Vogelbacteria bacterium]
VGKDARHLVVSGLMSAFKKIWVDAWSARMEYILSNTLLALLEYPDATLLGVNRMLSDKVYRRKVVDNVTDPGVRTFWVEEFANYTERMAAEAVPAIQNKVGQFTSNPLIRNMIGQPKSSFDFREAMDQGKIVLINLSKGRIGEVNANLLGSMLITKIYLAAMSRANLSVKELAASKPFYFFVDEFQSFANESFANILSEARKYNLSLTIAHQYVEQMSEEVRAAVFGNVGTICAFRVGPFDAEIFETIFGPTFMKEDMVNLGFAQLYLTLMIDGVGSPPFSAKTLPPLPPPAQSHLTKIIEASRRQFAHPRLQVEVEIAKWHSAKGGPASGGEKLTAPPPIAPKVLPPKPSKPPEIIVPEKVVMPPPKSVSLTALKKTVTEKSTGKHAADLKQVLEQVQKEVSSGLNIKSRIESPTSDVNPPVGGPTSDVQKPEVPEEMLKKVLG